jgi:hypothetical protein
MPKSLRGRSPYPLVATLLAGARCAVGAVLILKPDMADAQGQPGRLLLQTIGIRDLMVGTGTLIMLKRDGGADPLWTRIGLASDAADTLLAGVSLRSLGARAGLIALLSPAPFIAAGRYVLQVEGPNRVQAPAG